MYVHVLKSSGKKIPPEGWSVNGPKKTLETQLQRTKVFLKFETSMSLSIPPLNLFLRKKKNFLSSCQWSIKPWIPGLDDRPPAPKTKIDVNVIIITRPKVVPRGRDLSICKQTFIVTSPHQQRRKRDGGETWWHRDPTRVVPRTSIPSSLSVTNPDKGTSGPKMTCLVHRKRAGDVVRVSHRRVWEKGPRLFLVYRYTKSSCLGHPERSVNVFT